MESDSEDRRILRRSLLGDLTENDRERHEERLMTDDRYFEQFELVKEEVIDEYAEDQMTAEDREKFKKHFLTTANRRLGLQVAQALMNNSPVPKPSVKVATNDEPSFLSWLAGLFATPLRAAATALVLVALGLLGWLALSRSSPALGEGLNALADAYREQRPIEARVSDFRYAPWPNTRSGDEVRFDRTARDRAEVMLRSAATRDPGAAAEHALGKLYLFQARFDDAIQHLQEALKTDGNNARIHNDLAAAWLSKGEVEVEKGEEGASFESFGRSLTHLNRALEVDLSMLEALFNRALVRQHLKLFGLAQEDWKSYLEKDSTSPWADEARRNLKLLQERTKTSRTPAIDFESFRAAHGANDDQTAWRLLIENRTFEGGFIENRVLDEYLSALADGRNDVARERLLTLRYAGEVGIRVAGDHFISELVAFYAKAPRSKLQDLVEARRLTAAAHKSLGADATTEARELYRNAGRLFDENGNDAESVLVRYPAAHCRLLQSESNESLEEFEFVRREAEARGYRWLEGQSLNALANAHIGLNNYSLAQELTRRSIEVLTDIGDIAGVVKDYDQLGAEQLRFGNAREALKFHNRAVTLATAKSLSSRSLWRSYFLAAIPFHSMGLVDAAIDFTKESLPFAEQLKSLPSVSRSYAHLGLMYGSNGKHHEALSSIQRALDVAREITTERIRLSALGYASLQMGALYKRAGDFGRAIESYDEAIRLFEQMNFKAFSYVAHKGKFLSCIARPGSCPGVEQELQTALALYEEHRSKILETQNRYSFFDSEQDVCDVAIDYEFTTKQDEAKAFDHSESCRARSLLASTKTAPARQDHHAGNSRFRPFGETDTLRSVKGQIGDEAQIIQYGVLENKLLIWLVSSNRFEPFEQPISAKALEQRVLNYLNLIGNRPTNDNQEQRRAARELYDLLVKPVAKLLDNQKLLCIVPDKILNRLPFISLVSSSGDRYLIEEFAVTFSPSSTMFIRSSQMASKRRLSGSEKLLSVGNPQFDRTAFSGYRRLPAAGVEADEIGKLYDSPVVLTEHEATKVRVVEAMKSADVIHLATHAVVDPLSPMYSKLLLATGTEVRGKDANHGALRTSEIYELDLRARLVVLPACRTGIEQYYGGEGMVGIWSPFMTRNVPLIVASMWSVDSDSTKHLMINFHKFRRAGLSSASALQRAQVEMLHGSEKSYRQPYHWASFIAIGGQTPF